MKFTPAAEGPLFTGHIPSSAPQLTGRLKADLCAALHDLPVEERALRLELAALNMVLLVDVVRLTTPHVSGGGSGPPAASPFGLRFLHALPGQPFGPVFVECPNLRNREHVL